MLAAAFDNFFSRPRLHISHILRVFFIFRSCVYFIYVCVPVLVFIFCFGGHLFAQLALTMVEDLQLVGIIKLKRNLNNFTENYTHGEEAESWSRNSEGPTTCLGMSVIVQGQVDYC